MLGAAQQFRPAWSSSSSKVRYEYATSTLRLYPADPKHPRFMLPNVDVTDAFTFPFPWVARRFPRLVTYAFSLHSNVPHHLRAISLTHPFDHAGKLKKLEQVSRKQNSSVLPHRDRDRIFFLFTFSFLGGTLARVWLITHSYANSNNEQETWFPCRPKIILLLFINKKKGKEKEKRQIYFISWHTKDLITTAVTHGIILG